MLRIFPAMPDRWSDETVFHKLRTEGAFLVSAEWSEGMTQWILIESLAGEPCIIQTDMSEFKSDLDIDIQPLEGPQGKKRWTFDLKKGDCILLKRKKD